MQTLGRQEIAAGKEDSDRKKSKVGQINWVCTSGRNTWLPPARRLPLNSPGAGGRPGGDVLPQGLPTQAETKVQRKKKTSLYIKEITIKRLKHVLTSRRTGVVYRCCREYYLRYS